MQEIPMTKKGFERLTDELNTRKDVDRPRIIAAIAEARGHGDLSENAEYHAAKEEQSHNERRIRELEGALGSAKVVDPSDPEKSKKFGKKIMFGATVTIQDEDTEKENTYQIVSVWESDLSKGLISVDSPIGRSLINKTEGDEIEVKAPKGIVTYEILKVEYK
ncbi:MAG: transcription elongation factor GreA [Alphaproteobacteria bacterium]|nr:transcription elongation factor GreA [Alphaproteobacteria bacterium]